VVASTTSLTGEKDAKIALVGLTKAVHAYMV